MVVEIKLLSLEDANELVSQGVQALALGAFSAAAEKLAQAVEVQYAVYR